MTSLKICSFNTRGLNEMKKRRDVFNYLHKRKYDICLLQETHCTKEQENKWQNEWGYKAYFSSYRGNSRGVAILINNTFEFKLHNAVSDQDGRLIVLDCTIRDVNLYIANIYAPNDDDPIFFDMVKNKLENVESNSIILGGDYNVVQDYTMDTLNILNRNNPNAHQKVIDLKTELDMLDPWREQHPDSKIFTWHNSQNKQSRLDYYLVSTDIHNNIEKTEIRPGYRSDHSIVELQLNFNSHERGRGIWKFNSSLLKDEKYTETIKKCINETKNQYKVNNTNFPNDDPQNFNIGSQLLFDVIKLEIRGKTISYASALKKSKLKEQKDLENNIDKLHKIYTENPSMENLQKFDEANNKLKLIRDKNIEGIIMRSKAKWHLEGEKNTRYFCNLEKKHYEEKCISKLVDEDGNEKTTMPDILKETASFYKRLYTSTNPSINREDIEMFFDRNTDFYTLSNEEAEQLETNLTVEECYKVLKNMKANKSPGSDGFTSEFYIYFWNDLKHIMVNSFKESLHEGKLSQSQRLGIITCLPKPGKDKQYIKNWRPISLLNIDYKILSGTIANRIKCTLDPLISKCQKGFVSGRYIGECTRLVSDLIYHLKKIKKPGIILMIDFEKAFDSLEWSFLKQTLKYFNFGKNIIKWIKCFYTNIESQVINNGHVSERFSIGRGVRQGDPLSPYLFILCAEILARTILNSNDIKGLKIDNSEFLISQLADDTTFFLEPDEKSFKTCISILKHYSKISGLKINFNKTLAVKLNMDQQGAFRIENECNIKWQCNGCFTLLGITYDLDEDEFLKNNYEQKVHVFENILNTWNARNLTIYGKICIIKSIALSKLVHLFTAVPNPPDTFFTRMQNICFNFIWSGKSERIKRTTLYNTFEKGGFKVPNIKHFCMAQKIGWVKRLLNDQCNAKWKTLFQSTVRKYGGNMIWLSNEPQPIFLKQLNPFWQHVFQAWSYTNMQEEDIAFQKECIFYNKDIKINNKTIFFQEWYIKGITHINDLIDEQGNLYSWELFSEKFNIQNQSFRYLSLLHSIPRNWKKRIKESSQKLKNVDSEKIKVVKQVKKPSKLFYQEMLKKIATTPVKAQAKWNAYFEEDIGQEWKNYYTLPSKITTDTRLRAFQMKILHRTLPLNKWLFKCKIKETPTCTFCNIYNETIEHLLWECNLSKNLWIKITKWINSLLPQQQQMEIFNQKKILLGTTSADLSIEYIKLITKRYLYDCKLEEKIPKFENLLQIIKYTINLSKINYSKELFEIKWKKEFRIYFNINQ